MRLSRPSAWELIYAALLLGILVAVALEIAFGPVTVVITRK